MERRHVVFAALVVTSACEQSSVEQMPETDPQLALVIEAEGRLLLQPLLTDDDLAVRAKRRLASLEVLIGRILCDTYEHPEKKPPLIFFDLPSAETVDAVTEGVTSMPKQKMP